MSEFALGMRIYEFSEFVVEVIHNPNQVLSLDLQEKLVEKCTKLSRDSFGNVYIQKDFVRHCILDSSIVLCCRDYNGDIIAYSSNNIKFFGRLLYYLYAGGCGVATFSRSWVSPTITLY